MLSRSYWALYRDCLLPIPTPRSLFEKPWLSAGHKDTGIRTWSQISLSARLLPTMAGGGCGGAAEMLYGISWEISLKSSWSIFFAQCSHPPPPCWSECGSNERAYFLHTKIRSMSSGWQSGKLEAAHRSEDSVDQSHHSHPRLPTSRL